jgi:hypothetical protein
MNDFGLKKFKRFAKANRLRLERSEDGLPIVSARGQKYKGWHLYEGFGDDFVALYIVRDTPAKLKHSVRSVKKLGLTLLKEGDIEAVFKVPYSKAWSIAKELKMVKKLPSNQNLEGLVNHRTNI